jgi:hypothetical protein
MEKEKEARIIVVIIAKQRGREKERGENWERELNGRDVRKKKDK